MRKAFIIFMLSAAMCGVSTVCEAEEEVDVYVGYTDPNQDNPVRRSPALLPTVFIDGYTLSFEDLWGEYLLQIVQDDVVVYSTAIVPGMTYVNLPSTLSGSYEFRFVADTYYYYGYIDL